MTGVNVRAVPVVYPMTLPMSASMLNTRLALALGLAAAPAARAQAHEHEMSAEAMNGEHHMEMTALRHGTTTDSARAVGVAALLRDALKPYADTTAAVADGYKMFMPQNRKDRKSVV